MPIRVSNVRLSIDEPENALPERLARALSVRPSDISRWRILRKSLDTRDKSELTFVYSAEVVVGDDAQAAGVNGAGVNGIDEQSLVQNIARRDRTVSAELYEEPAFTMPAHGQSPMIERPVIVGSGPAGLFAALALAEEGYRPLVLERGRAVKERIADIRDLEAGGPHQPESNYLFGEGGAGTFSDGKLTCRSSGPDVRRVLEIFADNKGKPSVMYEHRPHLGSNRLPAIVKALRRRIEAAGGEFQFNTRMEDLDVANGRVRGVNTSSGLLRAGVVMIAIGHSARDTFEMLHRRNVPMVAKPFQFGVRIEHPQEQVNRVQYGSSSLDERLGAADYSLIAHGSLDLFTFCMCAGGQVIPSISESAHFGTNGMSLSDRASPFANSGLMVTLGPEHFGDHHVFAGMEMQRRFEALAFTAGRSDYRCPIQRADDFLARRATSDVPPSSLARGVVSFDLASLLPDEVVKALHTGLRMLERRWRGQFLRNATLVGPESRGSSPIRLLRDRETFEAPGFVGLYPIGEGAGYAGGIVSAAVDGLRAAKAVVARYASLTA